MAVAITARRPVVYNAQIVYLPEKAGQTFKRGDIVKFASNVLEVAAADDTGLLIAAADASGTTSALCPCWQLTNESKVEINLNTGVASAATQLGVAYGFAVLSDGTAVIDVTETTATRFKVEDVTLLPGEKYGFLADTGARVLAKPVMGADTGLAASNWY